MTLLNTLVNHHTHYLIIFFAFRLQAPCIYSPCIYCRGIYLETVRTSFFDGYFDFAETFI